MKNNHCSNTIVTNLQKPQLFGFAVHATQSLSGKHGFGVVVVVIVGRVCLLGPADAALWAKVPNNRKATAQVKRCCFAGHGCAQRFPSGGLRGKKLLKKSRTAELPGGGGKRREHVEEFMLILEIWDRLQACDAAELVLKLGRERYSAFRGAIRGGCSQNDDKVVQEDGKKLGHGAGERRRPSRASEQKSVRTQA